MNKTTGATSHILCKDKAQATKIKGECLSAVTLSHGLDEELIEGFGSINPH